MLEVIYSDLNNQQVHKDPDGVQCMAVHAAEMCTERKLTLQMFTRISPMLQWWDGKQYGSRGPLLFEKYPSEFFS